MSSHEKALEKKEKHKHKKGKEGKCEVCNMVMGDEGKVDEKGKRPMKEFGAKNNDSEED
jgi:hypothetical protein